MIESFIEKHWDGRSPLLVGYSGGPDSKALLYALRETAVPIQVAHVDHGWRKESRDEAEAIAQEMKKLAIPLHSVRLELPMGNEEIAREARFSYFRSLFEQIPFQALVLGHQADDQAETVLKRILEGAHLSSVGGMEAISEMKGMPIWRPLLQTRKKEMFAFLAKRGLIPFLDPTNRDPSYLRARMREEMIPFLNRSLQKEVAENLLLFSERAHELKKYLDQKASSFPIQRGEWGVAFSYEKWERIEVRHLLQKVGREIGVFLPRTVLEPVLDWMEEKASYRKIFFQSKWLIVRGKWLFLLHSDERKALPEKGWLRKLAFSFAATDSRSAS